MTTVRAGQTITTANNNVIVLSGADVTYVAQQSVELESGFQAQQGGLFYAYIDECADLVMTIAQLSEEHKNFGEGIHINTNPLSGKTNISYDLQQVSTVSMELYDVNGQRIAQPLNTFQQQAGVHTVTVQSKNFPRGMIVVMLRTNEEIRYSRFTLATPP